MSLSANNVQHLVVFALAFGIAVDARPWLPYVPWHVFPQTVSAVTSPDLVSFNFDWHPIKEGPGWGENASIVSIPLHNPRLRRLASAMSPAYLRIGGSEGDVAVFDLPPGTCKRAGVGVEYCLTPQRLEEVVAFCVDTGLKLAFGLNIMYGRGGKGDGPWDPSNVLEFIEYVAEQNLAMAGFEIGNEKQDKVNPKDYGRDVMMIRGEINRLWPSSAKRPLLIGPDQNPAEDWLRRYLRNGGNSSDVVTWHMYAGYGLDPGLRQQMMKPSFYDIARGHASRLQKIQLQEAPYAQIWVGETAAAWHSGQHDTTDAFASGFWFVDQLSVLADLGYKVMCRQCFVGGNYTMIGVNDGFVPRPDYWTGLIYKKLMGNIILKSVSHADPELRGYMHCTPPNRQSEYDAGTLAWGPGAVTFAFLNLDETKTFDVLVDDRSELAGSRLFDTSERVEYILTSPGDELTSSTILLNGKVLELDNDTDAVPNVVKMGVKLLGDGIFSIPPRSYGFVVWPKANASACLQDAPLQVLI